MFSTEQVNMHLLASDGLLLASKPVTKIHLAQFHNEQCGDLLIDNR